MMSSISHTNWYDRVRAEARARLATGHWPLVTEEEWRRSDVSKLGLDSFMGASGPGSVTFAATLSAEAVAAGVRLIPAREFEAAEPALERSLAEGDRFAAWNLAEGEAWALVLPRGFVSKKELVVDCVLSGRAAHPHLSVFAAPGSQADIVYRVSASGSGALLNSAVVLSLDEGSIVRFFESRESPDDAMWFVDERTRVARDARLLHLVVDSSGRFVKSRVDCSLEGPGADADLDGIFYASAGRQLDIRTVQRHLSPKATSRALYKGALDSGGRSVFQGLIEVAKEASGTDAFLANRNLVLGHGARADSIPTLRIGNNDVRCSHGSTTGKLSEAELFYLESRGFDRASAREFLVLGFFNELLDLAPAVFSEAAAKRLAERLEGAAPRKVALGERVA
ncbi:MAG TPA: SufD family Fe-S cluster assembly protein [Rectinemataceae bacterium]|nr:SufD family Fe-S cluster assembly protein [Rectinemataceae bacterium]